MAGHGWEINGRANMRSGEPPAVSAVVLRGPPSLRTIRDMLPIEIGEEPSLEASSGSSATDLATTEKVVDVRQDPNELATTDKVIGVETRADESRTVRITSHYHQESTAKSHH